MKPTVYIRADGNSEIGLGHVTRSLALAEMIKEEFDCIFVTRFITDHIITEARKVCTDIVKLCESNEHFDEFLSFISGNEVVVMDNYFYRTEYQKAIKDKGCKLVCIDDIHDKHFTADVVINHAPDVTATDYSVEPYTKCLLGTKYALLRKPFLKMATLQKRYKGANSAFVCFGGSDYNNITERAVKCLLSFNLINKIFVVTGSAYIWQHEMKILADRYSNIISYHSNIDSERMAEIMYNSDFAVVPCSSILWECMSAKLPVITGYFVDNQKRISDFFLDKCIGHVVGNFNMELFEEKDVLNLSQLNASMVAEYIDGYSPDRLLYEFKLLKNA